MNIRKRSSSTIATICVCVPVIFALFILLGANAGSIGDLNPSVDESNALLNSMDKKARIVVEIDNGDGVIRDGGQRLLGTYRQVSDWYILAIQESDIDLVSQVEG